MTAMRETLRCPECQHRVFWKVARVHERAAMNIVEMALYQTRDRKGPKVGGLESLICCQCGRLEWHTRDVEGLEGLAEAGVDGVTEGLAPAACPGCDQRGRLVHLDTVWEAGGVGFRPIPMTVYRQHGWAAHSEGHFSADICQRCSLVTWQAHGLEAAVARLPHRPSTPQPHAPRCEVCQGQRLMLINRLYDEAAHYNWPVHRMAAYIETTWLGFHGAGELALEVCLQCHHALWRARDLHRIHEDAKHGVTRIDARQADDATAAAASPYRRGA
jgi:hypothetical protein